MNGVGVGLAVGFGALIGSLIVAPGAGALEYISTFGIYGFLSGLIFQIWKLALAGWKPPFIGRR